MQLLPRSVPHGPLGVMQHGVPNPLVGQKTGSQAPFDWHCPFTQSEEGSQAWLQTPQ